VFDNRGLFLAARCAIGAYPSADLLPEAIESSEPSASAITLTDGFSRRFLAPARVELAANANDWLSSESSVCGYTRAPSALCAKTEASPSA